MTDSSRWKHRLHILLRIARKNVYRLLGSWNKRLQPREFFLIKAGYHHAANAESFDATGASDEFQRSVYALAGSLATQYNDPTIIDVGCGSAYKLIHRLGKYKTIGIEVEPTFSWLINKYPHRKWLLFDSPNMPVLKADIVICSDVIEHIRNPDELMKFLSTIDFNLMVLSTPERDKVCGQADYGPPENTSHYREWNSAEFTSYVSKWFKVDEHYVYNDRSITQVVVCTKTFEVS
jgi:2-polyprenyl-3-methyl-5-hydroxy-6-metoxy-1,4-benzoquinol methylase